MANGNGNGTTKTIIAWVSIWVTIGGIVFAAGMAHSRINTHMSDQLVHESPEKKQARIDRAIRENNKPIMLELEHIKEALKRIEDKQEKD